jgi:hypothetical protein
MWLNFLKVVFQISYKTKKKKKRKRTTVPTLGSENIGQCLAPEEITHEMNTWGLTH